MVNRQKNKFIVLWIIAVFSLNSFFVLPAQGARQTFITHNTNQIINLNNYLSYFYDRYSRHFDQHGLIFKTPDYGISQFRHPQTAREILSLIDYYKYRAMRGEIKARQIIKQGVLQAWQELNSRPSASYSFSDAWALMDMLSLTKQLTLLFDQQLASCFKQKALSTAKDGILAPDSENRAALSAVYWQAIVNQLEREKLISTAKKNEWDRLIYHKIKMVLDQDIDSAGWYREGRPKKFNPHYQLITAMAFASYAEMTGNIEFAVAAKKMVKNLRSLSFGNGMIEARLGPRPVGLGAQFYLGMGLLNYYFDFKDYAVYLNYARGDRFFSDPAYPDRLEYHSTIKDSRPDYHDDISFSNLAELALLNPAFQQIKINPLVRQLEQQRKIINFSGLLIKQVDENYTLITKNSRPLKAEPVWQRPIVTIAETYGRARLDTYEENKKTNALINSLKKYLKTNKLPLSRASLGVLAAAYIYGGYNLNEIIDTIQNGPRAVHPKIAARIWRQSQSYQKYIKSTKTDR